MTARGRASGVRTPAVDNGSSTTAKPLKEADMDMDQVLKEQTYKEEGLETSRRVFYTLTHKAQPGSPDLTSQRTAKLLALLVERLVEEERISSNDLDALLFEVIS